MCTLINTRINDDNNNALLCYKTTVIELLLIDLLLVLVHVHVLTSFIVSSFVLTWLNKLTYLLTYLPTYLLYWNMEHPKSVCVCVGGRGASWGLYSRNRLGDSGAVLYNTHSLSFSARCSTVQYMFNILYGFFYVHGNYIPIWQLVFLSLLVHLSRCLVHAWTNQSQRSSMLSKASLASSLFPIQKHAFPEV